MAQSDNRGTPPLFRIRERAMNARRAELRGSMGIQQGAAMALARLRPVRIGAGAYFTKTTDWIG
jgi:hypothetical protein